MVNALRNLLGINSVAFIMGDFHKVLHNLQSYLDKKENFAFVIGDQIDSLTLRLNCINSDIYLAKEQIQKLTRLLN